MKNSELKDSLNKLTTPSIEDISSRFSNSHFNLFSVQDVSLGKLHIIYIIASMNSNTTFGWEPAGTLPYSIVVDAKGSFDSWVPLVTGMINVYSNGKVQIAGSNTSGSNYDCVGTIIAYEA